MTNMNQRIWAFTRYLLRSTLFSLTGIIWVVLTLAYWMLLFNPGQGTPEVDYYLLIIGAFGVFGHFMLTLSLASRANMAKHYPLLVRLPSRIEYLASVLAASLLLGGILQGLLALAALYHGPPFSIGLILDALPIWTAVNILSTVLALHASDFVTSGWSRVWVYGILAILLFTQNSGAPNNSWLPETLAQLGRSFATQGLNALSNIIFTFSNWIASDSLSQIGNSLGIIFWPFRAIVDAVIVGYFTPTEAMAPAVILLYAVVLFMLAADLFANKDLDFLE